MYSAAVLLPLLGFLIAGAALASSLPKETKERVAQYATTGCVGLAALLSLVIFHQVGIQGQTRTVELFTWIDSGAFVANWAFKYDALSATMLCVVTIVSSMVHLYSIGYMAEDKCIPRFMAYLSLFTFFMLMLVTADNFVQMFFGWEGVGLASYLLIGFWYEKDSANEASIKAFLVNRVGDFGFALGIFGVFLLFGSVQFDQIFAAVPQYAEAKIEFLGGQFHALTALCLLLFVGACGKSAQLFLHTWLPDAMEGPTPVSALIHAATMVTAGVFMVCRLSPMFEYAPTALAVVTVVGASTALFAASVGLVQNDIKRVIAYSTCSQLGYMFFAAGVSAYSAAMFHLTTHAFFKALLFLSAGSVIHALHHEQDMRKMGGEVWSKIKITYAMMWIGSLALAGMGIPWIKIGFAGFYSKDIIMEAAWGAHSGVGQYAFWLGLAAATMTAFYSWRLIFMSFHKAPQTDHHAVDHAHESPVTMLIPLFVLAFGALFSGMGLYYLFVGDGREAFWGSAIVDLKDSIHHAHEAPHWIPPLLVAVGLAGIGIAYGLYIKNPTKPAKIAADNKGLYEFLLNKWYFDELYDRLFVRPSFAIGRFLWKRGDGTVIDGMGPDAIAAGTVLLAKRAGRLQTGYVYHYAFAMLIGIVALATWYILRTGR
ncbi:MAG: NADH-quinone oxidoreductase subunit L [Azospirillum sp.]|nr:NADH-quinone oxidoreductase subunit L [Azospirillum sp.]MCA3265457.1 NADH-quinone oxidoreductase subunit L [Azospirillum sp.]